MKTKSPLQSKTIWGGIVLAVLSFLGFAEVEISAVGEALATIIGFSLVLYGRIKAQLPVKLKGGSANVLVLCLIGSALLLNVGCQGYAKWAEDNPRGALIAEGALHTALVLGTNAFAANNPDYAKAAEALKASYRMILARSADEAEVARLVAAAALAEFPEDPEARALFSDYLQTYLMRLDAEGSGAIPASDAERVSARLLRGHLESMFNEYNGS